jgi:prepilin-type N-terminal cleavage/methylation domain-containing protein
MNCKAFTLAEVLITLGIIGIVAALTIPNLIIKYQKRATGARLKQAYAILMNTIRQSENEQGGPLSDEEIKNSYNHYRNDMAGYFKKNFVQYMSGVTLVKSSTRDWNPVTPSGYATYFLTFYSGAYCLNNGMCFVFINNQLFNYIIVDLNGPSKPNKVGHDVFYFMLHCADKGAYIDGLTYGVSKTKSIDDIYSKTCSSTAGDWDNGAGCTELVIRNNWQIPDDKRYPY